MRRLLTPVVCAFVGAVVAAEVQQTQPPQTPPPAQAPATPQTPQQQPVFRTGVDVIRLDVSVLDKDRQPIRGLTMEDFSVFEDGKLQTLVAVSEIESAEHDPSPSAWMRHVPRDVQSNDLVDQAGDGRLFAIVMDDWNIPFDDLDIIMGARTAARYFIDLLRPSDIAAVIYTQQGGKTQDFTDDRAKLIEAVDKFDPPEVRWIDPTPLAPSGGGGDMPYRSSPALMRSQCQRTQPAVPTLDTVASRLATVPNRRKTIVFISVGVPLSFAATRGCPAELADIMKDVFRKSERANINIYGIDPAGYRGYENYLQMPIRRGGRPALRTYSAREAEAASRIRREFLEITADHTGARAIVSTSEIEREIDRVFDEAGAYYLLGYQTSNGKPDGRFRKLEVKIKRPGATVRTRSGYYAPTEASLVTRDQKNAPTTNELGMTGMMTPTTLPLRTSAVPIALAGPGGPNAHVAVVLTVRLPAPRGPLSETLTLVRTLYDAEGRAGQPVQERLQMTLTPSGGDELRYDVFQKLMLAPGRYSLRLNATSTALDKSSSVYADFEVPDYTRRSLSVSPMVLGARPAGPRTDPFADMLPVVPTSARDFTPGDQVVAFLRVFQGGAGALAPVTVTTRLLDGADTKRFEESSTLGVDAFGTTRSAPFEIAVPLGGLTRGPYLLSITTALPNSTSVRRDLVFRMR
jgi:VWFA-related protein